MESATEPGFDPARRYVRVTRERDNGFVEFNFALGEPGVFVELILRREAFADFCADNRVEVLPPESSDGADAGAERGDWDWRLSDARDTRFR